MFFELESIANLKDVKLLNVQSYYYYSYYPSSITDEIG